MSKQVKKTNLVLYLSSTINFIVFISNNITKKYINCMLLCVNLLVKQIFSQFWTFLKIWQTFYYCFNNTFTFLSRNTVDKTCYQSDIENNKSNNIIISQSLLCGSLYQNYKLKHNILPFRNFHAHLTHSVQSDLVSKYVVKVR